MKTFLLSLLSVQFAQLGFSGDANPFFYAFLEGLLSFGLLCVGIAVIIFAVTAINRKAREREITKALKLKFDGDVRFVVLQSMIRSELKDFFYENSNIENYFESVDVFFNDKTFQVPVMMPVKITKLHLSNNTLEVYVDVVEMECDFEVIWVGKSFGKKPLGDDAMRVSIQNINFGDQQVSMQESQIPKNVKKGDKVRMKFAKEGDVVKLIFIKSL